MRMNDANQIHPFPPSLPSFPINRGQEEHDLEYTQLFEEYLKLFEVSCCEKPFLSIYLHTDWWKKTHTQILPLPFRSLISSSMYLQTTLEKFIEHEGADVEEFYRQVGR